MNREIISRYIGQPASLPNDLRAALARAWNGEPVQLYALADLDHTLKLQQQWLALGASHVAIARSVPDGTWTIESVERSRVRSLRDVPGLSANTLLILGDDGAAPLLVVRYTQRQRAAVENVRFVLDEALTGRSVTLDDADRVYADAVARPVRDAQALVAGRQSAVMLRLLRYLVPYRRQVIIGLSAAAVVTLASLLPPYLAGYLIDRVVRPTQEGRLTVDVARRLAWVAVGAMALLHVVRQAAAHLRLKLMSTLGELVARDLRAELYAHIQRSSLAFFSRKKTGSLISRVTADTDRLWEFIAFGVVDVSLSLVMLAGLGAVLLTLDWRLGLVMTLPVPAFCWLIYRHGESLNGLFIRTWRKWSRVTDILSDTIPGIRVVKAFNQETREIDRFVVRNDDVTDEINNIHALWTRFWPGLMLAVHATTVLVWVLAVPRLLGSGHPLSAGVFVSFLLYTTMFVAPIEVIGQMVRTINRAVSSAHRVFEVLDSEPEVKDSVHPIRLSPVRGHVRFENVTFAYDGVRQILRGVSFDVQPGELVGLVGPSGGGKSTIVSLIARFYDVSGGAVRVDGVNVRDLDTGHYREQLGMVLQDPYLFHGTVLENIRYGLPSASLGAVVDAGQAANAHDFICKLGQGTTPWSASGDTRCRVVSVSVSRSRERSCMIRGF